MSLINPLEGRAPSSVHSADIDDGRDYTQVIIARMRGVSGLLSSPGGFTPKPTGGESGSANGKEITCANIGKRSSYSRNICIAVYQLIRIGVSELSIADRLGIPVKDILTICQVKTEMQRSIWRRVQTLPDDGLPDLETVVKRMARELNASMPIKQKNKVIKK